MLALTARFTLQPGTGTTFDRLAADLMAAVEQEQPGPLVYLCHTVKDQPDVRFFYEIYPDEATLQLHGTQPHLQQFFAAVSPHFAAPPQVEMLEAPVGVGAPH